MPAYVEINGGKYELAPRPEARHQIDRLRSSVGKRDIQNVTLSVRIADAEETLIVNPGRVVTFAAYETR